MVFWEYNYFSFRQYIHWTDWTGFTLNISNLVYVILKLQWDWGKHVKSQGLTFFNRADWRLFKHFFSVRDWERLLKASKCYLSTTSGPLADLLSISTDKAKLPFAVRDEWKFSLNSHMLRIHYKGSHEIHKTYSYSQFLFIQDLDLYGRGQVFIPLNKMKCVN